MEGNIVETDGFPASVGSVCEIDSLDAFKTSAEVIGFRNNKNLVALHKTDTKLKVGSKELRLVDEGVNIEVGRVSIGKSYRWNGVSFRWKKIRKI